MGYDRLAESVALIARGVPDAPARLSRRRRFLPLAVDVAGDAAVTVFLRRGAGSDELEGHVLTRADGTWRLHGGGGGSDDFADLVRSKTVDEIGGYARVTAGGGVLVSERPRRWIAWSWLDVVPDVAVVAVGDRTITVPWHHHVAVVRDGERPVPVILLDAAGKPLGVLAAT